MKEVKVGQRWVVRAGKECHILIIEILQLTLSEITVQEIKLLAIIPGCIWNKDNFKLKQKILSSNYFKEDHIYLTNQDKV